MAISSILPLLVILTWVHTAAHAEGTVLASDFTEDTTLTKEGSPYYINASLKIMKTATLSIEPGVELISKPGTGNGLTVYGKLKALGTATEPIQIQGMYISAWTSYTKEAAMEFDHTKLTNSMMDAQDLQLSANHSEFSNVRLSLSGTFTTLQNSFIHDKSIIRFTSTGLTPGSLMLNGNTFINNGSDYYDVEINRYDSQTPLITMTSNNFFKTTNRVAVKISSPNPGIIYDGKNNYWGSTDPTLVDRAIYDEIDHDGYGDKLNYQPYAFKPIENGYPLGSLEAPRVEPLSDKSTTIKGATDADATIRITKDGSTIAEGTSMANGSFEFPIPAQMAGTILNITAIDSFNRISAETTLTVKDETAPDAPTIQQIDDQSIEVKGTAEANATITAKANGTILGSGTADENGHYQFAINVLAAGTVVEVTAADAAGNVSQPATVTVKDTTPPASPGTTTKLTDQSKQLAGTAEPGATIEMLVDDKVMSATKAGPDGKFTLNWTTALTAGTKVWLTAIDPSGNRSVAAGFTVQDVTAPYLWIDWIFPPTTTNPVVKGKAEAGATLQVWVNGEIIATSTALENGTFSITIPAQPKGTIVTVVAMDAAQNQSSQTIEVLEIDNTPPLPPAVDEINILSMAVTGRTEPNSTIKVIASNQTYFGTADENGYFSIVIPKQPLNDTVFIWAIDQHQNESPMVTVQVKWTTPSGWYTDQNGITYYYYPTTGKMAIGWFSEAGKWYYFEADGRLAKNYFRLIGSKVYYFNDKGVMQTGWFTLNSKKYYFGTDGARRTGIMQIDGKKYYFTSEGVMQIGWISSGGKWYYFNKDGTMKTGWLQSGTKWYFMNPDGTMKTGWLQTGGKWYYLNPSGVMQTGWLKLGTKWYYFNSGGTMQTGWVTISGKRYFFNSSGVWVK